MGETKRRTAHMLVEALKLPRQILITILLGNELINVSLSIVSAALISRTFAQGPIVETIISVALVTPMVLLLGEVVPQNLALRFAPLYSQIVILPLKVFSIITYPLRVVLTTVADLFIKLLGGSTTEQPMIMEQEYRHLIDLGKREGVIIEEEREIIHSIFEFTDKVVANIMTPANMIFTLPIDAPYEDILRKIKEARLSRVPFFAGEPNNIIGILHVRDLFAFDRRRRMGGAQDLNSILIKPLFVAPDQKLEELLRDFQQKRVHMAIVKEKEGPIRGVVTMDDVLEELFGEMEEQ
jgi:CBS domain containing-hemolysin-like protein